MPHQHAGIDVADAGDTLRPQVLIQGSRTSGTAPDLTELLHHQASDRGLTALLLTHLHSIVADVRRGHGHDLTRIARVAEDLLITGHAGIETDLAHCDPRCTDRSTPKKRSIGEQQDGFRALAYEHARMGLRLWPQRYLPDK